ncbi:MAG: hypothetical protein CM1200mP20_15060 [Pseudomonadota bacterium]|nr:MAG: hypothetical protein CM1200mP20_15060 [Pseudomonadota bacterium]
MGPLFKSLTRPEDPSSMKLEMTSRLSLHIRKKGRSVSTSATGSRWNLSQAPRQLHILAVINWAVDDHRATRIKRLFRTRGNS